ncbi:Lysophospholipase L1 [Marininema mesophilum]|uniref:Lysophospholipase L1 n=1 Tax=Marininema mesophilum TaxID=1048340 RepID=A0A1H2WBV5_9BACL|nr:SGNH/GDSL hydrolase family protein [Marininema mesophilum]SDW77519.1 Lysophospholipase L1 [Marininema mesophilum]
MKRWIRFGLLLVTIVVVGLAVNNMGPKERAVERAVGFQPKNTNWVGAWTAAHQYPSGVALVGIKNQTVRMIVKPHINGEKVQIRISNAYGKMPITFQDVSIAVAGSGAEVLPDTLRKVTFNGKNSVIVPVGQEIQSDPISLQISRDEKLAVSMFVPKASGPVSWHRIARQISYISEKGNHTFDLNGDNYTFPITSWYWLSGVNVQPVDQTKKAVVTVGDSITDGVGSTGNSDRRYPDYLAERFRREGIQRSVLNAGISGNKVLRDDPIYGPKALDRFERDVLNQPGVSDVILLEGVNDIGHLPHNYDPDTLIKGYRQLIEKAHKQGIRVYMGTILPFGGATYHTPEGEATRKLINDWIRNSGVPDGVVDFDKVMRDPSNPSRLRPAYDSGDHLHPRDAGYQEMANAINLKWFR